MQIVNLTCDQPDNGNCRVYYRNGKALYCFQSIGSWGTKDFELLTCTKDGEPSCPVNMRFIGNVELPIMTEESICQELAEFMTSPAWCTINAEYTK